jgi:hypothetical protein
MGVKGFSSWLEAHAASPQQPVDPTDTTLFIDAGSFAFHVLDSLGRGAKRELGGHYGAIGRATVDLVETWTCLGYSLVFVMDGKRDDSLKDKEDALRRKQWEEKFAAVVDYVARGTKPRDETGLPAPSLFLDQIYGTLEALQHRFGVRMKLIQAEGEADPLLAQLCFAHNQNAVSSPKQHGLEWPTSYVLSNDSDFYFVKGIRFIPLSTFRGTSGQVR